MIIHIKYTQLQSKKEITHDCELDILGHTASVVTIVIVPLFLPSF